MSESVNCRRKINWIVFLLIGLPLQAGAETVPNASGSITVDGERVEIEQILVDPHRDGFFSILVSDTAFRSPCEPLDAMAVSEERSFSAVLFTLDEELSLTQSYNALYHPSLEPMDGYGKVTSGLELDRSDGLIRGALQDTIEVDGREFEIDLEFAVSEEPGARSIAPRTVTGVESEPARVFAELVDAVVAADLEGMMERASADMRQQLESGGEVDVEMLFEFADWLLPQKMTIVDTEIEGERAVLTAKGETSTCTGTELSDGRIEMVREAGEWKLVKASWES